MKKQRTMPHKIWLQGFALILLLFSGCTVSLGEIVSITPTSVMPSIIPALLPVVSGQGVPETAAYDPGGPGPHPMVILTTSGEAYKDWNEKDPYHWLPASVGETELVVLVGEERESVWATQAYSGGPGITSYVYEVDLELREARTGRTLATTTYKGALPESFPYSAPIELTRIEGSHLTYEGLETWICPYIILQGCWMPLRSFKGPDDTVLSLAFSQDAQNLAYGTFEGGVGVWRVSDGALLQTMTGQTDIIRSVAFSPDGKILASLSMDDGVFFWQVSGGELLHTLEGQGDDMISQTISPDGQILATGSVNDSVQLWQVSDGTQLAKPRGHTSNGSGVAFSPDGLTLAAGAGSYDSSVILWQVTDGTKLRSMESQNIQFKSVAFSPDGRILASGSDQGLVLLWQVSDGSLLRTITGPPVPVTLLAFTPDAQKLIVVTDDDTVRLWNISDGRLLRCLEINNATEFAISPDGTTLAVSEWDGIHLWQMQ